jgi:hypothetical protein
VEFEIREDHSSRVPWEDGSQDSISKITKAKWFISSSTATALQIQISVPPKK